MALTGKTARALEQVRNGLNMLYGADYFTEEEWIKLDGLIHKGSYVFTNGPPTKNFLEDELMSFDETKDTPAPIGAHSDDIFGMAEKVEPTEGAMEATKVAALPETSYEPMREADKLGSASLDPSSEILDIRSMASSTTETPIPQSLEISSDEEQAATPQCESMAGAEEPAFDLSSDLSNPPAQDPLPEQFDQAIEPPKRTPVDAPKAGGLAYYTQAQLDEIKAFNKGLTRAGEKKKPTHPSPEASEKEDWAEECFWDAQNQAQPPPQPQEYPTPISTDEDHRIQNWASGVSTQPTDDPKQKLVNEFIQAHGRMPKSINDIYPSRNKELTPATERSASRATSVRGAKRPQAAKSISSIAETGTRSPPDLLRVPGGTVLIAHGNAVASPGHLRIEIMEGDKIKVLKHVSGVLHYGINLRTMKSGQFNQNIFKPAAQQQQSMMTRAATSISNRSDGMQQFERVNASEWDEVPQRQRPQAVAPTPARSGGGLGASRFAVLADDNKSEDSEGIVHGMTREDVDKLVDEKFERLLKARQLAPNAPAQMARSYANRSISEHKGVKPVPAKTATCWFWATPGKDCRFTAEECRDLHSFTPTDGSDPVNLRMGKPTWGALADAEPTSPLPHGHNIILGSHLQSSNAGFTPVSRDTTTTDSVPSSQLTCHFWANEGKCAYSATQCKFLHAWGTHGVAKAPKYAQIKSLEWSRWDSNGRAGKGNEEPTQSEPWKANSSGWGTESANANGNSWDTPGDEEPSQKSNVGPWRAPSRDAWGSTKASTDGWELPPTHEQENEWETVGSKRKAAMQTRQQAPSDPPVTSWGTTNDNSWDTATSAEDSWGLSVDQNDPNMASASGWGDINLGKPAHVLALEEKARVEAVGW